MSFNSVDPLILQLPKELLMEILEYVPRRWNVALVCIQFYEVICMLERNLFKLNVKNENIVSMTQKTPKVNY